MVAVGVTQEANDVQQLKPMLDTMERALEVAGIEERPRTALADAGYWSEANVTTCNKPGGPELLIATTKDWKQRKLLRERGCPRGRTPQGLKFPGADGKEVTDEARAFPLPDEGYSGGTGVWTNKGWPGISTFYETRVRSCHQRGVPGGYDAQPTEVMAKSESALELHQGLLELKGA